MTQTDITHNWNQLFAGMAKIAKESEWSFVSAGDLSSLLGAVGLVQPFDWNAWKVAPPELHELWNLSEEDCIKHVTRITRAERFYEGALRSALKSGRLAILCMVAFGYSQGQRMHQLAELETT